MIMANQKTRIAFQTGMVSNNHLGRTFRIFAYLMDLDIVFSHYRILADKDSGELSEPWDSCNYPLKRSSRVPTHDQN